MSSETGYSKRTLAQKLGLKAGLRACFLNVPPGYFDQLGPLPPDLKFTENLEGSLDFIQFFTASRTDLLGEFPDLKAALSKNGQVWLSWPKGSSKLPKDLNENQVREIGLDGGLVDVKVIAIDAVWSGLKFVYRVKDR